MKITIISVAIFCAVMALSWAITAGILKLISICFGVGFSLPIATGIWLIMFLLRGIFSNSRGGKHD